MLGLLSSPHLIIIDSDTSLVTTAANLTQFILSSARPNGLLGALLPVIRSSMGVIGARIILNLRGVAVNAPGRCSWSASQVVTLPVQVESSDETNVLEVLMEDEVVEDDDIGMAVG